LPSEEFADASGTARQPIVLCPGAHTTANLLYRLFFPGQGRIENVVFSDIMPRLRAGLADFGVCIHEGRFTYQQEGLACVADLGALWEQETHAPLPLGGIVARLGLGAELHRKINTAIRASVEYGLAHRAETVPTMKRYAQEFSEKVLFAHVDLYVNDWTVSLSTRGLSLADGRRALILLCEKARQAGVVAAHHPALQILGLD
jgi:1,4-dihydroxy-6-naphthoate synthase